MTALPVARSEDHAGYRLGGVVAGMAIGGGLLAMITLAAVVSVFWDDQALRTLGVINLVVMGLTLLAGLVAAVVVVSVSVSTSSRKTRFRAVSIGGGLVFLIPVLLFLIIEMLQVALAWQGALLSIPTTAFAIWMYRRMQRNRRLAWHLILLAFAWGMLVASYFAQSVEGLLHIAIRDLILPGTTSIIGHAAAAAFPEEIAKGAGVAVIILIAWRRMDGMLSGIVIGACVGLGFQFAESMGYMAHAFDTVLYQHWYRQVSGIFLSHAAYTGIIGAGLGLATQVTGLVRKFVCAASGFLFAIAAHLVWDIFAMGHFYWESDDPIVQLFVAQPLNLLVFKGPVFLVLLVLVIMALRLENRSLYRQLRAEAALYPDVVAADEVLLLLNAPQRFRMRLTALREGDWAAFVRLRQLHTAQLHLAFVRWRRERGLQPPPWAENELRQRIHRLKAVHVAEGVPGWTASQLV